MTHTVFPITYSLLQRTVYPYISKYFRGATFFTLGKLIDDAGLVLLPKPKLETTSFHLELSYSLENFDILRLQNVEKS